MILTIAYLLLIAGLLGLAAVPGERLCAELGWPRRSAWFAALVASVALPAYAIFFVASATPGTPILTLPQLPDFVPAFNRTDVEAVAEGAPTASPFNWPDWQAFDSGLLIVWATSSVAMLLACLFAGLRLRAVSRQSESMPIGDQHVLLSDSLGPAVLGLLRPRIVLPRWLAEQESALRTHVLSHEREHIAARDQLTLFAAVLLVASMPWNIALWWQLRRLRAAIECDCDSRVLRDGANAHEYSKALLTVGRRSMRVPFAAVALIEPVSELEHRIRIMLTRARDFSVAGFGARAIAIAAALGLAIAVNAPNAQQSDDAAGAGSKVIPTIRTDIYERLTEAQACLDQQDPACAMEILDTVRERPDLNVYESAQLYNYYAFVHFELDDMDEAAIAYESILALPESELPAGLVQSVTRNLATLYMQLERYQDGLDLLDRWMALPSVTVGEKDYYQKAMVLYQMEQYANAIAPLEQAIAGSAEPIEEYYQLLYVLNFQIDDQQGVLRALEILNERWPGDTWAAALAGAEQRAAASDAARSDLDDELGTVGQSRWSASSDYLPVVKVAPVYPPAAAAQGLEGYTVVSYTVTATGLTTDIEVIESSDPIFNNASIESAAKYKYQPRVVDGAPVEVPGVTTRIVFELENDAD